MRSRTVLGINKTAVVAVALLIVLIVGVGVGQAAMSSAEAPDVSIEIGPQIICPGWNPHYTLRLTNTLDQPLTNLVITHPVPEGTCLPTSGAESTVPGVFDAEVNAMVWRLDQVEPGAQVVAQVVLHSYSYLAHGLQIRGAFQYRADGRGGGLTSEPVVVDRNRCGAEAYPTLTSIPSPTPSPTPVTLLRFDPTQANVEQGLTVPVTLTVENVDNLFGIEIEVTFDPLLMQVADADPAQEGTQIRPGIAPLPHYVVFNDVDNEAGRIRYVVTQLGPIEGFAGTGPVFGFDALGVAPGQSALTLKAHELATSDGGAIAHRVSVGSVQVTPPVDEPPIAGPATVFLEPENLTLAEGQTAIVKLLVSDITDLVSADVHLLYDPTLLRVEDEDEQTPGIQAGCGELPFPDQVWENAVDQTAGTIWYSAAQAGSRAPASGSGVICVWRVTGLAPGASAVQVPYHVLVNSLGEEITHALRGGSVEVTLP